MELWIIINYINIHQLMKYECISTCLKRHFIWSSIWYYLILLDSTDMNHELFYLQVRLVVESNRWTAGSAELSETNTFGISRNKTRCIPSPSYGRGDVKSTPYSLGPLEPLSQAQLWQACNACLNGNVNKPHLFWGSNNWRVGRFTMKTVVDIADMDDTLRVTTTPSSASNCEILLNFLALSFYPFTSSYC